MVVSTQVGGVTTNRLSLARALPVENCGAQGGGLGLPTCSQAVSGAYSASRFGHRSSKAGFPQAEGLSVVFAASGRGGSGRGPPLPQCCALPGGPFPVWPYLTSPR